MLGVAALLLGALVGATLVIHVDIVASLAVALVVLAVVAGASRVAGASDPLWVR